MLKNYLTIAFGNRKTHKGFSFINILGHSARLVILSILIASPLAWWVMNNWLKEFACRIDISWWMFVLAASIAMAIANLVKTLRTDNFKL